MNVQGRYYYNLTCKDTQRDQTVWYLDDETYLKYMTLNVFGKDVPANFSEDVSEEDEEEEKIKA